MLDGPARRTMRSLVFGAFAISLGHMLEAGAPIVEALRVAARTLQSATARDRIERVLERVRDGASPAAAFDEATGFPPAISRLIAVGETIEKRGQS